MSQTLKAQMQNLAACIAMTGWLLARVLRGCWLNCSIKGFERVFLEDQKNEDLPLASCFKTTKKGAPSKKTGPFVYFQLTWPVAVFSSFLHVCVLGAGLHAKSTLLALCAAIGGTATCAVWIPCLLPALP